MKIKSLKINNFGKIENKQIELNNNINLIYGKNESGKSTLLKFIFSIFYGASKNKNGKEISDYEKYKPWNEGEYSGKLTYILDEGQKVEVYRDFSKKNPKIYDENMNDISKNYNIDKTKGNEFFYEQTGIDEKLFLSTAVTEQNEVILDNQNQKILTQKIANILSTGEDNISFKKSIEKLNKKLIEEIGTDRTVGRPLNNILEEIKIINQSKNIINNAEEKISFINKERNNLLNELNKVENELYLLNEIKNKKEEEKINEEKIRINNNILQEYNERIDKLKNKKINKNKFNYLLFLLLPINIAIYFLKNKLLLIASLIISLILILINFYKNKEISENIKIKNKEIKILEKNKNDILKNIEDENKKALEKNKIDINKIINSNIEKVDINIINEYMEEDIKNINNYVSNLMEQKNKIDLDLHRLEFDENKMKEEINRKIELEERLQYLEEQKSELEKLQKSIYLAKEVMEIAYNKMKNEITPKFTKKLSEISEKISNGKYKNVIFNDEEGLKVELENGDYINCNKLSLGTIDQLYLSLRLSTVSEVSKEKLPIILDEAFAYYDDERLENILNYLNNEFKEYQIIIFTCSNREKKIMDKLNINYNLVEI